MVKRFRLDQDAVAGLEAHAARYWAHQRHRLNEGAIFHTINAFNWQIHFAYRIVDDIHDCSWLRLQRLVRHYSVQHVGAGNSLNLILR